eukprot:gb/GEZN01011736.1/.p1 GENE.gb/GEZN01011736.1/~~gb/GEZN01011736.1/.p1  ORF type:complete len:245 (+),score=48.91 gb/GEZN01011736.1/:133-867(+)
MKSNADGTGGDGTAGLFGSIDSAATAAAAPSDPTKRLRNKTVEEILTLWDQDLQDHYLAFMKQATEIRQWDDHLIKSRDKIIKLQETVGEVQLKQDKLERILDTIQGNQQELRRLINQLDQSLQGQVTTQKHLTADERKREEAYSMAESINQQLAGMQKALVDIVRRLNDASQSGVDVTNPLTKIVKILNVQMNSLQWVEHKSLELDAQLRQAQAALKTSAQNNNRKGGGGGGPAYNGQSYNGR